MAQSLLVLEDLDFVVNSQWSSKKRGGEVDRSLGAVTGKVHPFYLLDQYGNEAHDLERW